MNIQFQYYSYWTLLAAIPVGVFFFILLLRWKKKVLGRMGDIKLVQALTDNFSRKLFAAKWGLFSVAFMLGVLAVMNPRIPGASESSSQKGIDIVLALDLSKSMLSTDVPTSRLEKAKEFISKLIDKLPDDRFALVWFAGSAYLQMPLSIDEEAAKMYASTADPDAVPVPGTVISQALEKSSSAFSDTDERFKVVILLTDGEDHDPDAVKTANTLAEKGIMVNTIGIGTLQGTSFTDPATNNLKKDEQGNTVISKLNEDELKKIADITKGIYIHLQNSDEAVSGLTSYLSRVPRKAFLDKYNMDYRTLYFWPAAILLLLLVVETIIPERKRESA
ncbi:MAG: VWA domain-containing protein [Bacteroidetes bacterium]|nr:VWA domain-containing protein [Bacteroidota bacterium]MBS1633362.1 VWA domain-containing protein [Bacteroidota bacterium]